MYTSPSGVLGTGAVTGGALAATGLNVVWLLLATFALISAGMALLRMLPRHEA